MGIDLLKIVTTLCEAIEGNNNQGAWRSHQRITSWWRMQHEINSLAKSKTTQQQIIVIIYLISTHQKKSAHPGAHNVNIAHNINQLEACANRTNNQIDTIEYSILSSEQHKSP